jgi:hypothetical protein
MAHRFPGVVLDQVALGKAGHVILGIGMVVIPGQVLWLATRCNLIVPGSALQKVVSTSPVMPRQLHKR